MTKIFLPCCSKIVTLMVIYVTFWKRSVWLFSSTVHTNQKNRHRDGQNSNRNDFTTSIQKGTFPIWKYIHSEKSISLSNPWKLAKVFDSKSFNFAGTLSKKQTNLTPQSSFYCARFMRAKICIFTITNPSTAVTQWHIFTLDKLKSHEIWTAVDIAWEPEICIS